MSEKHRIAVVQLYSKPLQLDLNYSRAEAFIRDAAAKGADLAALPEYHITGWKPEDPQFVPSCAKSGTYLEKYKALAKELSISIVPGTLIEVHKEEKSDENILWNVAYFIGPDGTILGRYVKKNLWHPERDHLSSSRHDPHPVFDTPLGKVGMLICWDLAFPEAFRELIGQGAKIIVVPTFWTLADCTEYGLSLNPGSEKLFLTSTVVARAFENTAAIVFVNAGGPKGATKPGAHAGLSQVALPFVGGLGDETKDTGEEGMSVVEVDMRVLDEAEKNYKVREDMARDDWWYTYRHDEFEKPKI